METSSVGRVHHVSHEVDLSSQMLDSRENTMATKESRVGRSRTDTLHSWGSSSPPPPPRELDHSEMALAVSQAPFWASTPSPLCPVFGADNVGRGPQSPLTELGTPRR